MVTETYNVINPNFLDVRYWIRKGITNDAVSVCKIEWKRYQYFGCAESVLNNRLWCFNFGGMKYIYKLEKW